MVKEKPKKPHVKKPLNAFMLFMKEQRAAVVSECTLRESAAINQILGRKWHELERTEQAKYYEKVKARRYSKRISSVVLLFYCLLEQFCEV